MHGYWGSENLFVSGQGAHGPLQETNPQHETEGPLTNLQRLLGLGAGSMRLSLSVQYVSNGHLQLKEIKCNLPVSDPSAMIRKEP